MKQFAYFSPNFFPDSNAASIRSQYFVSKIMEKNKVDVYSCSNSDEDNHVRLFFTLASNQSSIYKRLILECLTGLELGFRLAFKSYRAVILSSPPFLTLLISSLMLKVFKLKYILDIRDIYPEVFFEAGLIQEKSLVGRLLMRLTKLMYLSAEEVITVSKGCQNSILKISGRNPKVILNGFTEEFKTVHENDDVFNIVFHGNLGRFQNIELLIEVMKRCESEASICHFHVIGYGPQDILLKNYEGGNLKFYGKQNHKDVLEVLRKMHLGLSFRSSDEIGRRSMPVKVFEYIGGSIPVIVTPFSDIQEIIEKREFGYVFENEAIINIVELIKELSSMQDSYNRLVENLDKYKGDFSRELQAEKILNILALLE